MLKRELKVQVWLLMVLLSCSRVVLVGATSLSATTPPVVDIVAILPDRHSVFRNGLHNSLLRTAKRLNVSLEIRSVGPFGGNATLSNRVFQDALNTSSYMQPKVYCVWPINDEANEWMRQLHDVHNATIIKMIASPEDPAEWDYIEAFVGSDSTVTGTNAAKMVIEALGGGGGSGDDGDDSMRGTVPEPEQHQEGSTDVKNVAVLGYMKNYAKGKAISDAMEEHLQGTGIRVTQTRHLKWGSQPSYDAVMDLLPDILSGNIQVIYGMDDVYLQGAYQAIQDIRKQQKTLPKVILVGSICNGARQLLEEGEQFATTVASPFFDGYLAISTAVELIRNNGHLIGPRQRIPPAHIIKADSWESTFVEFQNETYTADELCTWTIEYNRAAGLMRMDQVQDDHICLVTGCNYVPSSLFVIGYVMVAIIYILVALCAISLYIYRKKKVILMAQPSFLGLVLAGTSIDTSSIIFMSQDNRTSTKDMLDISCIAWPWLLCLGHMITIATLVTKIYRVKKVCGTSHTSIIRKANVSIRQVSFFLVAFLLYDIVILSAWLGVDPLHWVMQVSDSDADGHIIQVYGSCESTDHSCTWIYPLLLWVGHLGVLVFGNVLVYQTRHLHKISDSKHVAIALFNSIQLLLVAAPLLAVFDDNLAASYILRVVFVFFNNVWVIVLIVLRKVYVCVRGQGDVMPDFHSMLGKKRLSGLESSGQNWARGQSWQMQAGLSAETSDEYSRLCSRCQKSIVLSNENSPDSKSKPAMSTAILHAVAIVPSVMSEPSSGKSHASSTFETHGRNKSDGDVPSIHATSDKIDVPEQSPPRVSADTTAGIVDSGSPCENVPATICRHYEQT